MLLTELFKSSDLKITNDGLKQFSTSTVIDGQEYRFKSVLFPLRSEDDKFIDSWDLLFGPYHETFLDYELTGKHVSIKVMNFVMSSLQELEKRKHPEYVNFEAGKDGKNNSGRLTFYKKLAAKYLPNYEIMTDKEHMLSHFLVYKRKE